MNIKICSLFVAPNVLNIDGYGKQKIPAKSEFTIPVRVWAEIKRSHKKWIEGGHIYAVSENEEMELLERYESSFRESLSEEGSERVRQTLETKHNYTPYEVQLAKEWLADDAQNRRERAEFREDESLKIAKSSESHAKVANWIASGALVVSFIALVISMYGMQ